MDVAYVHTHRIERGVYGESEFTGANSGGSEPNNKVGTNCGDVCVEKDYGSNGLQVTAT